jgi:ligand-binding sensor domain-containing protein
MIKVLYFCVFKGNQKMRKAHILIFLFALIFFQKSYSDTDFKQISIENGLAHTDANCISQDSTGLIWIGTYGGLQSYDGYTLRKYSYLFHS